MQHIIVVQVLVMTSNAVVSLDFFLVYGEKVSMVIQEQENYLPLTFVDESQFRRVIVMCSFDRESPDVVIVLVEEKSDNDFFHVSVVAQLPP